MSDFEQKILLTFLDKGVLAIVALTRGYWINKRFEDYKAGQQRARRSSECRKPRTSSLA